MLNKMGTDSPLVAWTAACGGLRSRRFAGGRKRSSLHYNVNFTLTFLKNNHLSTFIFPQSCRTPMIVRHTLKSLQCQQINTKTSQRLKWKLIFFFFFVNFFKNPITVTGYAGSRPPGPMIYWLGSSGGTPWDKLGGAFPVMQQKKKPY